jgi:CRP-like cAMP-binding protein
VTVGDKVHLFKSFEGATRDEVFTFIYNIWEQQCAKAEQTPNPLGGSRRSITSSQSSSVTLNFPPPPPPLPSATSLPFPSTATTSTPTSISSNSPKPGDLLSTIDKRKEIDRFMLSEEDRAKILKGAKCLTYQKDEYVISEGDMFQRIYQLARGSCRIEKLVGNETKVLGRMTNDDGLFGEISFLEGCPASASVIADEPDTAVYVIEGYFLNILFEENPGLSGRFYHYLAHMLSKRLKQREAGIKNTLGLPKPKKTITRERKHSSHHRERRSSKDNKEHKEHKENNEKLEVTISSSLSSSTSSSTTHPLTATATATPPHSPTSQTTVTNTPTNDSSDEHPSDENDEKNDEKKDDMSSRGEGENRESPPSNM